MREFMHVRVQLDITKPLLIVNKISIGDGKVCWIQFSYERLPNFCYYFGKLGYGHYECEKWESIKKVCKTQDFPYEQWLQARREERKDSQSHGRAQPSGDVPLMAAQPSHNRETTSPVQNRASSNFQQSIASETIGSQLDLGAIQHSVKLKILILGAMTMPDLVTSHVVPAITQMVCKILHPQMEELAEMKSHEALGLLGPTKGRKIQLLIHLKAIPSLTKRDAMGTKQTTK